MKFSEQLQAALDLLGPNGENWIKGWYELEGKYCASGAVRKIICPDAVNPHPIIKKQVPPAIEKLWQRFLSLVLIETTKYPSRFNDLPETTFEDIKELFAKVIEKAKKEEAVI